MKSIKLFFLLLLFGTTAGYAQGWERKYSPDLMMGINSVYQLPNYSYLVSGVDTSGNKQRLMNIDATGNVLWQQDYDSISLAATNIAQNSGYVMLGFNNYDTLPRWRKFSLLKVNGAGQKRWLKTIDSCYYYPNFPVLENLAVDTTDNGGFICTLNPFDTSHNYFFYRITVQRTDSNGNVQWTHSYFDADSNGGYPYSYDIRNSKDGGFLVCARLNLNYANAVFKIDSAGNLLWTYYPPVGGSGINASIGADGNILVSGSRYIAKLSQAGTVLWVAQSYSALQDSMSWMGNQIQTSHNTFALLAEFPFGGGSYSFSFTTADTANNILIQHNIPTYVLGTALQLSVLTSRCMIPTADGGYILGGMINGEASGNSGFLIKMDSNGIVYSSNISGYVYYDANSNCIRDTGELDMHGIILTITTGGDTILTTTDDRGYYSEEVSSGTYQASITTPSNYWAVENCGNSTVNIPANTDTTVSFALVPSVQFPYLTANANFTHITCHTESHYTAQFCNTGTAPFTGVVDVTFDTLALVDSANIPWQLPQTGNVYVFPVDTLGILDCIDIIVYYHLNCGGNDVMGTDFCIDAHAYSDSVVSLSANWDRSNLLMKASCNTGLDSVVFTLKNTGTGNMNGEEQLLVIEDNVILMKLPVQLNAGETYIFDEPANTSTWRATVPQTAANPYSAFTTAAVEGCGNGAAHLGFINEFPYNGFYGFDYTVCAEIEGPIDPNYKSVLPEGAGNNHIVDSTTLLEYTIGFQNTGTDTAYNVRVVDTLAAYLNAVTIKPGVSSFPYTMQFLANNIIAFTFLNIDLPDSSQNAAASSGYVNFKISQSPGNAAGTVINNDAAIFFDYNPAVITNTASVTVGQLTVSDVKQVSGGSALVITAFPNPFNDETIIKIEGAAFNNMQMSVYDLSGKTVRSQRVINSNQFLIQRNSLSSGSYIFEITSGGQVIAGGKL